MAENRKDGEAGLYFCSKPQLILVAGGVALTCLLVFLLGIVIGQGIEERKLLKQEEPLVKVPIQPPAASAKPGQGGPAKDDQLTFYDTLGKSGGAAPSASAAAPAEKPAKAEIKPVAEPQPDAKAAEESKPAKAAKVPPADAAQKTESKEKAENKVKTPADKGPAPQKSAAEDKGSADAARDWTVQVNAFPDDRSAQRLVERLKQKGYDAYVVTANFNG